MMAQASDLTTFCPTVEDILLPEAHMWDPDGLPKFIELGMRDWKWRSKANKGKRYGIRLWRNYCDAHYCPVFWLLFWLNYSGLKSGPIFQQVWHPPLAV